MKGLRQGSELIIGIYSLNVVHCLGKITAAFNGLTNKISMNTENTAYHSTTYETFTSLTTQNFP